jgi:hypothetical protein
MPGGRREEFSGGAAAGGLSWVALSLCTTTRLLYTGFAKKFGGTSVSAKVEPSCTGGAGGLGGQRLALCDFRAGRSRGTADWDTSSAYEGTASRGRRCHSDAPHYISYSY